MPESSEPTCTFWCKAKTIELVRQPVVKSVPVDVNYLATFDWHDVKFSAHIYKHFSTIGQFWFYVGRIDQQGRWPYEWEPVLYVNFATIEDVLDYMTDAFNEGVFAADADPDVRFFVAEDDV